MSTTPRLICLSGPHAALRGTVAQLLHDDFGYQVMRLADPVHDMVTALFQHLPEADEHLTDPELRNAPLPSIDRSVNELTASLLMEWAPYQPRLLEQIATAAILRAQELDPSTRIVIADTVQPREIAMARNLGAEVWHVNPDRMLDTSMLPVDLLLIDCVLDCPPSQPAQVAREVAFALHEFDTRPARQEAA